MEFAPSSRTNPDEPQCLALPSLESFSLAVRDSYLKCNRAKVVSCERAEDKDLPKAAVGETLERLKAMQQRWKVVLSDSVLYPIGGGQPSDSGWIGDVRCEFVEPTDSGVIHWCVVSLELGQEVEVKVDWDRRWYHMQHHTGQHVLSAVALDMWSAPTNSWDLATDICHVDIGMAKPPTEDALKEFEGKVNDTLRQARQVRIVPVRGDNSDGQLELVSTNKLSRGSAPAAGAFPVVRFVEIEGLDFNPCGGTHVKSSAELQAFKLISTSKDRGNIRLSFLCGSKLIQRMSDMLTVEAGLLKHLCCQPSEMPRLVEKKMKELREKAKQKKTLEFELASHIGNGLNKDGFVTYHWNDVELPSLQKIANTYTGSAVLWLTCAEENKPKGEGSFLLSGETKIVDAMVKSAGDEVRALLQGKGGGAKGKWQGKAESMAELKKATEILEKAYEAAKG
eukprot:TRINITY_DN67896_c0_g1_i1.p1 TRINITY_DN67896_c0_g1~~TRINITY_DN67896_c0_g1_i1.p1  ORF type:complete len:451 (-),score=61.81 TRINITY_DN67896_c0_g1_i1:111-1463(-)